MTIDKHSQDAVAKLYAEWVSAGVRLSVAGFAASTKILEAATQSVISSRAHAKAAEKAAETAKSAAKPAPAAAAKPENAPTLKVVPKAAKPAEPQVDQVAGPAKTGAAPHTADDLKRISGIGPKLEQMLVAHGLSTFAQIAALDSAAAAKLDNELNLNGRIQRDDWMGQAAKLAG